MASVEELTDIPPSDVDEVIGDYLSQGATVKKIKQTDGNWTVRATFDTDTHAKHEDDVDCCSHAINDEDAIPDEDLPTAVGGV